MSVQTSYAFAPTAAALAGQLGDDLSAARIESTVNGEGDDLPAGVGVVFKAAGSSESPDAAGDVIHGIVVNSFARDPDDLVGADAVKDGNTMNMLTEGTIWVKCENTVAAGAAIYCRHTTGTGTQLGAFRADTDSSKCAQVLSARVLRAGSSTAPALVYFSASAESGLRNLAAAAATLTTTVAGHTTELADHETRIAALE